MIDAENAWETEFLTGLIELQYGRRVQRKMKRVASEISWAKGWPENKVSFWNAEAFMWGHKISAEKRGLIAKELEFLKGSKNIDLGCGAYSYLPSTGFDLSERMLLLNENCTEKISGDLEKPLPFTDASFDSATIVFVLNYVVDHSQLLNEARRVLKPDGSLVMVLSASPVNGWQRQKEVNAFTSERWISVLKKTGFMVSFKEKEGLWFFKCR
ncbi:MAG: class I SAM-dependent methyltransferase [Nanoarchaeota archaeon]